MALIGDVMPMGPIWRIYRFEIVAVVAVVLGTSVSLLVMASHLDDVRPSAECMANWVEYSYDQATGACRAAIEAWRSRRDEAIINWLAPSVPLIAGVVLGSVLVSREIEHRTAQLGWSLRGSRARWLAERLFVVTVALAVLLGVLAITGEAYAAADWYHDDVRQAFWAYGVRGTPVLGRGAAALGMALLVGALLGRQLPALLVSGVLAVALVLWLGDVLPYGTAVEWVPESVPRAMEDMDVGGGWFAPDGTALTLGDVRAIGPYDDIERAYNWASREFEEAVAVLRGPQLTEVEVRETLITGTIAIVALGGAFVVVGRRRPY